MTDVARPDIKPAFAERNVPVALATDENYLSYLKVTINSAIASSPRSNLDIIVLHAGILEDAILDFTAGYASVGNASVRFVDISDELETSGLSDYRQTARLPLSSCYRLLLPRILPAYGKIVYIDVDVAVCRDLGELYETDVGDNWFAAAKDVVYTTKPEYVFWAAKWGFAEWDGYVNAGVLVMNLERFRREPVLDRLKEIVFEAAKWNCDQDALNFVCKGAIAPLDPRWNVQLGDYCFEKQIALTGEEKWIAHYTSLAKPWKLPARRYSYLWWRHAAEPDVLRLWAEAWGVALVQPVEGVPKVSIIIPVYNSARYLPEALASVLMQKDMPEIEVICIDDGSTDDSAAILDFWEKRDSRLKVLRQVNAGPGVARNAGIDAAKGEYIFFLDADDRLSSGRELWQAYEQAREDRLDILLAQGSIILESGEPVRREAYLNRKLVPEERVFAPDVLGANLYTLTPMEPAPKLFRRQFLNDNRLRFPPLKRSEDFPMIRLALSLARRIGIMQQSLFNHRIGVATSLESTKDETPLIFADAERIFRDSLSARGLLDRFKRAADAAYLVNLAYNLRKVGRFASFRAVARLCAEKLPELTDGEYPRAGGALAFAFKQVSNAAAAVDDIDALADFFAAIREARSSCRSAQNDGLVAQLRAEKSALWGRLKAAAQGRNDLSRRMQAAVKREKELWQEKMAAVKAKGDLWKRLQAKEVERRRLADLVQRLTQVVG